MAAIIINIGSCARGFREPSVIMDGNELTILSPYGVTLAKGDIKTVRLLNEIPPLIRRGGFGVLNTQKGKVKVSNLGEGLAYVKVPNPPYIYIELTVGGGNYVFINLHDADDTLEMYENIQVWLD